MKILITGNMGYVGPALVRHLYRTVPDAELVGYDMGYFAHALTSCRQLPERMLSRQLFADVRKFDERILDGIDAVVALAAISNDPMGNRFEKVTDDINHLATVKIARKALHAGVKHIVFASSCSIYGYAEDSARAESSSLSPLTAYARSKIAVENGLSELDAHGAVITSLRFATACGMSDRLRLDLVLNDFVACALATGRVSVLSDGTPWRPLIEVRDMARAIEWALTRSAAEGGAYLAVNVGSDRWNYRIRELAEAVSHVIPGTDVVVNASAPPDKRSYRVDFSLYEQLAPRHQPRIGLEEAIDGLKRGLVAMNFADAEFRSSQAIRLKVLERHIAEERLTEDLTWTMRCSA
jgi:nucleoside-diphosphate-sugar epimerase